jgi:RNA polymerase-binding transcription factor
MDAVKIAQQGDRLRRRRHEVALALQHLAGEQRQVEQNTDWLDQAAFESRVNLLDRLDEWYRKEMGQLDNALDRIQQNRYGVCSACHQSIDQHRLDTAPEAEFCSDCQGMREDIERM